MATCPPIITKVQSQTDLNSAGPGGHRGGRGPGPTPAL